MATLSSLGHPGNRLSHPRPLPSRPLLRPWPAAGRAGRLRNSASEEPACSLALQYSCWLNLRLDTRLTHRNRHQITTAAIAGTANTTSAIGTSSSIEYPALETLNHIFMAVTISHTQRKHFIAREAAETAGPPIRRQSKRQTPISKKPPRMIFKVCMLAPFKKAHTTLPKCYSRNQFVCPISSCLNLPAGLAYPLELRRTMASYSLVSAASFSFASSLHLHSSSLEESSPGY